MSSGASSPGASGRLRVDELFASVQGESTHVGKPCAFIRLTGCNLRCAWCDTTYAFTGGSWMTIERVIEEVGELGHHTVELTGGEPLAQSGALDLLQALVARGHEVLLETSGSLSIADVPPQVHIIMDLKAPGSGQVAANRWANLELLRSKDEVKVVIASREDFEWAADVVRLHRLAERCPVLFAPAWGLVEPRQLVEWILAERLPVRLQLQIHKLIWDPSARGV